MEEKLVQQVWSQKDERFLPDRYVVGVCPHCGYEAARGDQCDGCGTLLDPTDLVDARSAISGDSALEIRASRHLFLRQTALVEKLRAWVESRAGWPSFVTSLAKACLTDELQDRCITRDLSWGVPVPRSGFEGKVFYVWFDAPINYIAITKEWSDADPGGRDWRRWWWDVDDVRYIQFLGKDNVPFHAVSFPATLIGAGEPWKTVDVIKGFHWLTYEGGKFSTSRRRGVFTDAALEALPADLWRWWLIANAPETADVDFSIRRFVQDVGKDLADVFGNLATRTTSFAHKEFGGAIPAEGEPGPVEEALASEVASRVATLRELHERLEFRRLASETRAIWALANAYFQAQAPWTAIRSDPARAAVVTRWALNLVHLSASVAWSVIPDLATRALEAFGPVDDRPLWPDEPIAALIDGRKGRPVAKLGPLVRKSSETEIADLENRFSGEARQGAATHRLLIAATHRVG